MEEKPKLREPWPRDRNDLSKPSKREHVLSWEVTIGNVVSVVGRGAGPRQVCGAGLEMGPWEPTGEVFWKVTHVGEFEQQWQDLWEGCTGHRPPGEAATLPLCRVRPPGPQAALVPAKPAGGRPGP